MDGGEGWWDLDLGGPECDGGGVKVWIRKKPQKKLIFVLSVYDLCCCVCVCVSVLRSSVIGSRKRCVRIAFR